MRLGQNHPAACGRHPSKGGEWELSTANSPPVEGWTRSGRGGSCCAVGQNGSNRTGGFFFTMALLGLRDVEDAVPYGLEAFANCQLFIVNCQDARCASPRLVRLSKSKKTRGISCALFKAWRTAPQGDLRGRSPLCRFKEGGYCTRGSWQYGKTTGNTVRL